MVETTPRMLGGRYEVGELIGRGGMAEVHIGHDTRLGRTVAIKILRSDLARDPAFQARFQREAQSAASLNYPAIVAVYDSGEDTYSDPITGQIMHVPYIVMEYVEGHTVREILNHGDAVPIDEAVEITSGVLSALDYSHHAGIIHRDIKPGNVMITPTGAVKVMDFGIARAVADSAATMTQTQAVIGTAQYLSPEQARGETVDARSDIYSTGCLLFELLTGRPPFVGDSPVAVAYQHVGQAPMAPSDLASDVPPDLDRITLKALAKERNQRYSSAAEFKADLDAFLSVQAASAALTRPHGAGKTQVMHPPVIPNNGDSTLVYGRGANAGPGTGGHDTVVYRDPWFPPVPPETVIETVNRDPHPPARPGWGPLSQPDDDVVAHHPAHPVPEEELEEAPRSRLWLWILIPLLIVGLGFAAFFLLRGAGDRDHAETAQVPHFFEGVTQIEACAQVEEAGFVCNPQIDPNSNADEGTFLRQEPFGGTELEVGEQVTLWFSGGPSTVIVPNVHGMTVDQATQALEAAGLVAGPPQQETNVDQPAGNVTRTEPRDGFGVPRGQVIDLFISNGLVDVPDLTGMSQQAAIAELQNRHLTHVVEGEPSTTHPPGTVIRQNPVAGAVDQGSQVRLTIAEEPAPQLITVPNVVGQNLVNVLGQFQGLNVDAVEDYSGSVPSGSIISIDPGPGTQLAPGATVRVVVSRGPQVAPSPVPPEGGDQDGDQGGDQGGENRAVNPGGGRAGLARDTELDSSDETEAPAYVAPSAAPAPVTPTVTPTAAPSAAPAPSVAPAPAPVTPTVTAIPITPQVTPAPRPQTR